MRTLHTLRCLAVLAIALAFTSCEYLQTAEAPGHNLVVPVDISGSAVKDLEAHAPQLEDRLLRTLGPKDRLVVLAIDNASETWADPLFELDMSTKNFVNPNLPVTVRQRVADQQRAAFLDSVSRGFRPALLAGVEARAKSSEYTDIFGAFTLARKKVRPGAVNHLIVLSDMLHESASLNFHKLLSARRDLMKELPKAPKADLPFEQVLVFTGNNSEMKDGHYKVLETFWKAWFTEHNVPLRDYTSGGMQTQMVQR
jgi:hypothetical protein